MKGGRVLCEFPGLSLVYMWPTDCAREKSHLVHRNHLWAFGE